MAFFAIGAYSIAILTSPASFLGWELGFWIALPIVMVVAAVAGLFIGAPVLRLRGDYLAIVTLGIGEIVRLLIMSEACSPGRRAGHLQIPPLIGPPARRCALGGGSRTGRYYYPILLFCVLAAFVATAGGLPPGRAWNAMREDEDVAEATGVEHRRPPSCWPSPSARLRLRRRARSSR